MTGSSPNRTISNDEPLTETCECRGGPIPGHTVRCRSDEGGNRERTSPGLPESSSLTAVTSPLTGLYTSLAAWHNNAARYACEGLPSAGATLNRAGMC